MSSPHHHHSSADIPISRVDGPCLLHGSVGVAVAIVLQWVGMFDKGDARLMDALLKPVFHGQMPEFLSFPLQILITAVFCYGLAFAVLDTAGTGKRIGLGITVLMLVLTMVPTLAVWNIYFPPFLPVVGVFWTWFCCMMYVSHHVMPCEVAPVNSKISMARETVPQRSNSHTQSSKNENRKEALGEKVDVTVDTNQKYKPNNKANG